MIGDASGRMSCRVQRRRWLLLLSKGLLMLAALGSGATIASTLSIFRHQWQAERHCPDDRVVWLDLAQGVYYVDGQRRYAEGTGGTFACLKEARRSGYRRSLLGLR